MECDCCGEAILFIISSWLTGVTKGDHGLTPGDLTEAAKMIGLAIGAMPFHQWVILSND